jgi:NAD(P)-dependent dehydrogenase (short-subunit alcohol dehydrogenase family)
VDTLDETVSSAFNIPEGVWRAQATDSIKMKKLGESKHVAGIVSYLASKDADWTTGEFLQNCELCSN